jgi:ATP-binding cassette subfamily C protein
VFRDIRSILGWLDGSLRFRWALLVPIMSAAAVIEAVGAIAVFGLLRMVIEPTRVRSAPVVSQLWQAWPTDDPSAIVAALTGIVGALYVVRALFLGWAEWVKDTTVGMSIARAGETLFSRYLSAPYLFHLKRRSTTLMTEISGSTDVAFQYVVGSALTVLTEATTIAALVAVLAFSAPPTALVIVVIVIAFAALPLVVTRRAWVRFGTQQKQLEGQQLHILQQSLGGVKEIKIAGREAFFEARFRSVRRGLTRVKERRTWVGTAMRLTVETVLIVSLLGVILLVTLRGGSGADTVSLLALFAYTGFRAVPSANRIMLNAGYIRDGRAYVSGALRDFALLERPHPGTHGPEPAEEFTTALVCERVGFRYDEESLPALVDVSLTLLPGESLGIVGATGSGKSTLVDVMLGLLTPTSGRVLLDDLDLKRRERAWQRLVGYVPQDPYLLDDTVRRNVAFGVPDALIDEQRLARACTLAQLDEVIRQLPSGLETLLGDNGTRLSGGQRQRVAIARALYADPAVLVFDEATAALDNQTEREVTNAIATLHGTRTLIVIAHRLSTVKGCDRLIFLREGRIAATGTYDALLRHPAFEAMAR